MKRLFEITDSPWLTRIWADSQEIAMDAWMKKGDARESVTIQELVMYGGSLVPRTTAESMRDITHEQILSPIGVEGVVVE